MENIITGENILLRRQRDEDADFFAHWYSDPRVMAKCGFTEPISRAKLIDSFHRESPDRDWYTIVDKASGRIVGETGLLRIFPEWYTTDMTIIVPDPDDQGHGYGTQAVRLMFDRAFRHHGLNRVAIGVVGFNASALRFYEKMGFRKEGIQEQGYFYDGQFCDFVMMRILKREYEDLYCR